MVKTTVYFPDELDVRLEARANLAGTSKAELVRRAVTRLLDQDEPAEADFLVFPVYDSGRSMTPEEMDEAIAEHIAESAARR